MLCLSFVFSMFSFSFVVSAVLVGTMTILCFVSAFCVLGVLLFVCGARRVWLVRWLYCVLCLSFVF